MKIIFNLCKVGLGNNGGSRTIVKSAETLADLGHEVVMVSDIRNKYTWEKIKNNVSFVQSLKIPKGDVIVATGFKSVKSTVYSKIKKKFYFIRGYEIWAAKREELFRSYKSLRCIVNSCWLKQLFKNKGIKCDLIYNGLDFDDFYNMRGERFNDIGGLFSKKHKTKNHSFVDKCASENNNSLVLLNRDIKGTTPFELNQWYNTIKIWISSSELEGLHNPPMEASLSGCGLIATDHPRSGTSDYVIPNETALVYSHGDKTGARKQIERLISDDSLRQNLNDNMVKTLKDKIGTRKKNMQKMIDIFKR